MNATAPRPSPDQLVGNLDVVAFYSAHVEGFRVNGASNVKCKCPFHGGDGLSVNIEDGRWNCHSTRCGKRGSAWHFLQEQGKGPAQIASTLAQYQRSGPFRPTIAKPAKAPLGPIIATYDYHDERGELLFQVTRHPVDLPPPKNKTFRQRRPDGHGGWIDNVKGVRRVLYGLPRLIEAVKAGETIYVVAGEKDADAINGLESGASFFATTMPMGEHSKWSPDYTPFLDGADVVIVADKDEPGRKHALDVQHHLRPVAKTVKIVEAKTGKDSFDHLAAGHGLGDFVPFTEPGAPASIIEPTSFRDVSNPDVLTVPWLIEGLIPASGLTIVAAHYKTGKTFLMYRLILDALFGQLALGSFPIPRPLKVQLWQFEMPLDVNLRRFHKLAKGMAIEPERIYQAEQAGQFQAFVQPDLSLADPVGLAIFHEAVTGFAPDLLLVDSLSEAFAGVNVNNAHEVRAMLRDAFRPVTVAGRGTVALHHKRKASNDGKEDDGKGSILGSQAFGAAARTVYTLDRVRDDKAEIKGRFVVSLAPQGGWDLETAGSVFVIADNEAGTLTTVDPAQGKKGSATTDVTMTTRAAVRLAELVWTRRVIGRQTALESVRLELKCGQTVAKDALRLAIERKWIATAKAEGSKKNEQVLVPGANSDWDSEL